MFLSLCCCYFIRCVFCLFLFLNFSTYDEMATAHVRRERNVVRVHTYIFTLLLLVLLVAGGVNVVASEYLSACMPLPPPASSAHIVVVGELYRCVRLNSSKHFSSQFSTSSIQFVRSHSVGHSLAGRSFVFFSPLVQLL